MSQTIAPTEAETSDTAVPGESAARPIARRIELVPLAPRPAAEPFGLLPPPVLPWWRRYGLFIGLCALPTFLAVLYFGFLAADRYTSETAFMVRSSSAAGAGAGLSGIVQSESLSRTANETYAVTEYMRSRDAAVELSQNAHLRDVMDRPEGDMFNRFPGFLRSDTQEGFYRAYKNFVDVEVDGRTGISTLSVTTFRPEDSAAVAGSLMQAAETFVNRLNERANTDSVQFSETMVREAEDRLKDVEARLADYRNTQLIVDPERESEQSLLMLGRMATEISRLEATLSQQQAMTPDSPANAALRERIAAYRAELQRQQTTMAGAADSVASKLQGYELLVLQRELAAKTLGAATASLEAAKQEAQAQRVYLQTVSVPYRPDQALEPKRLLGVLVVALLSLCIFWIARSLVANMLDRQV